MSLDELADKELPVSEAIHFAQSNSSFRSRSPGPIPIPDAPTIRSLVDSVSDERANVDVMVSHQSENGSISTASSTVSSIGSEKAAYEFLPQTPIKSTDAHLVEFSEAMRTVAKALRRVAEGKAAAQAEAIEWKRNQLTLETPVSDQSGCCGKHGICSHEVLQDEVPGPNPRSSHKMVGRKASFKLSWGCNGDKNGQHKHDFVSFEKGDITTAERSNKQAASLFKGPVPPVVAFSLGSLGFMTPFPKDELETEEPILALNEVTIDRGISSYLTYLECYCDSSFVTCVQGDGLIISTTSGSTAYSLAAGGSMVHPQVPGILFTPICPHSLSFRPLILPEYVTLRVQVPFNSRGQAWASFDGKDRKMLSPGDALICSISPWPVPTACVADSTTDFLRSIHEGLHWNLRKTQSFDGPRE
ncbi:hypothetical protein PR202_gb03708 [Eleusine coracana subsp. coracana]|uniref:Uncharacterized protein n=1 Tax=Eleusine coracana subsp. coracana TaxID=191504 RepID=A0AAV5E0Z6_ELECO|nr:hypothetical protein PR202_gb03708 [Eleusine coracana subsp. coracana]